MPYLIFRSEPGQGSLRGFFGGIRVKSEKVLTECRRCQPLLRVKSEKVLEGAPKDRLEGF